MTPPAPHGDDTACGLPRWIWLAYAALFGASIPWYLPGGPPRIWLGLPHWVVLSLAAVAGVSVLTAFVVCRYWRDDDAAGPVPHGRDSTAR